MPLLKIEKNRFYTMETKRQYVDDLARHVIFPHVRYIGFTAVIAVNIPLYVLKRNNNTVWICKIIKQNYHKTTYEHVSKNHKKKLSRP